MISPFMPLHTRSGIYTYLPAVASAILLGAAVRSFYQRDDREVPRVIAVVPVLLVVATFTIFIIGQSQRWITTAETTTEVLNQMSAHVPSPQSNTYFVLRYAEPDRKNKFPGGLTSYAFPSALRLHYADPTLNGTVVQSGDEFTAPEGSPEVHLLYTVELDKIRILRLDPTSK